MARLIVKSPYIKCGGRRSAGGYMRYIATRERVELIQDDRPPTRKQEQLIVKLVKEFPDARKLDEYADYQEHPNKANASAFISQALEENWSDVQKSDGYMKYIATRPRAEQLGTHGLFGDTDGVELDKAMAELESYTGNVWTHIISLKREDAERLGYDNARAWRNLLRAHRNDIAAAMNIPPQDFRWYAAFHDEGDHPHVHMMAWSVKPGQAYLSQDGICQIKSKLTNDIFQQEMLHLYEQKTVSRDQLVREARQAMRELVQQMRTRICDHPEAERLMQELALQLETVKGKKSYGYLPKEQKALVDEIVDQMEQLPTVAECYEKWWELQSQVEDFYSEKERHRPPLSRQKEFRQIKNAVIQEAETIRLGEITFEDDALSQSDGVDQNENMPWDIRALQTDIQDESSPLEERDDAVDRMRWLAECGDGHAQYFMGKMYLDGSLVIPDSEVAMNWFHKASTSGYAPAQYALGKLLLSDDVSVHDSELGIQWLEYAAYNGNHYAAYRLGKEYLKGDSVRKDTRKAMDHIYTSAQAGNPHAQYLLGKLLIQGKVIDRDKDEGIQWLTQAAEQGHGYAQCLLERQNASTAPEVFLAVTRLLHHMANIFQDNSLPQSGTGLIHADRKLREQLREKRLAHGHKEDDHEEQQYGSWNMTMH
ncbi:MobP3 family relaxase [Dysosmobacter sp.]|uniref:MobP3 family relaxase n=1 Tax=Dysosmobacter sp. TaxID=2591382 RepID=UPI00267206C1|nr:MobP3 family relaxase [Dysosmobacter sp.]MCI7281549.1 relaxase MobL [Dysosmobacter sp.]